MALVFQYGSNTRAARLNSPDRLDGHALDIGRAKTLEDFDIAFNVYSDRNGCAASDLVERPGHRAWGVLYEIADNYIRGPRADGARTLKRIEGGRYKEIPIRVEDEHGAKHDAITFVVRRSERNTGLATSAAYVSHIIYGLRDHGVPEDYLHHVIDVAIATNNSAAQPAHSENALIAALLTH